MGLPRRRASSVNIFNFITPNPRGGNFGLKIVKMKYFFKNLHIHSGALFRQYKCIVMIVMEGSTQIVNFMTPGAGVLLLGCAQLG